MARILMAVLPAIIGGILIWVGLIALICMFAIPAEAAREPAKPTQKCRIFMHPASGAVKIKCGDRWHKVVDSVPADISSQRRAQTSRRSFRPSGDYRRNTHMGRAGWAVRAGQIKESAKIASASAMAARAEIETGLASIYSGLPSEGGSKTANGERVQVSALTAAHKTLPFGTMVEVTNIRNGRSVVVRINDRGPFVRGRVIDLTPAGARAIGFSGLAPVKLEVQR